MAKEDIDRKGKGKAKEAERDPRRHYCTECNKWPKGYARKSHLARHIKAEHGKREPHHCPHTVKVDGVEQLCNAQFWTKNGLVEHIGAVQ